MLTKIQINKQKLRLWLVVLMVQAGSFGMGMYTAHTYWQPKPLPAQELTPSSLNYTTNQANPKGESSPEPIDPTNCTGVKGNISGSSKTYHIPGGSFYERTTPEMCFANEQEAQSAGFTKSTR